MRTKIDDEKLVAALLVTQTQEQAAKMLGINVQTISARKKDPSFIKKYRTAKQELVEETAKQLLSANAEAVQALRSLLNDNNSAVRVSAAKTILSYSKEYIMLGDLQQRIEELEQSVISDKY